MLNNSTAAPLSNVSTLAGSPLDLPVNLKNVGFTPVKDKAKPANATTASSTF